MNRIEKVIQNDEKSNVRTKPNRNLLICLQIEEVGEYDIEAEYQKETDYEGQHDDCYDDYQEYEAVEEDEEKQEQNREEYEEANLNSNAERLVICIVYLNTGNIEIRRPCFYFSDIQVQCTYVPLKATPFKAVSISLSRIRMNSRI